jgi:hypothetical protein
LESLPHTALPTARFNSWCGQNDRYLLDENGQLNAYEAGTKVAEVAVSPGHSWQCRSDGRELIYFYEGQVSKVDIVTGDTQWLASFDGAGEIAFSPDFKSVATSVPLELRPPATQLKVILVREKKKGSKTEAPEWIKWSENGSKIVVVYRSSVEILDRNGANVVSMTRPATGYVRDGWFEKDQRALTLFLDYEQPPGFTFKCSIAEKKCDLGHPRIESISVGKDGTVGTVTPIGKPPALKDDGIPIYAKYAVEIRNANSRLLVQHVLSTRTGRWSFQIAVSPSGKWSILTWDDDHQPGCKYGEGDAGVYKCGQGMLVDLSKVIK